MKNSKICLTKTGLVAPPGRLYLVSLPIVLDIPVLKTVSLYVHRALPGSAHKWCVTETRTGKTVGRGPTRKEAIDNAQSRILKVGNTKFEELIKNDTIQ